MKKYYKVIFENKTLITSSRNIAEEVAEGRRIYDVGTLSEEQISKLKSRPDIEFLEKKGGKKK